MVQGQHDTCLTVGKVVDPVNVDLAALGRILASAGYTADGVRSALGISSGETSTGVTGPLLIHRTRDGSPVSTLIRLFIAGVPVPRADVAAALAPSDLDPWFAIGLIRERPDHALEAVVALAPVTGFYLCADFTRRGTLPAPMAPDCVMGVGRSTLTLAALLPKPAPDHARPINTVLDLGCGCGYLAMLGAARAAHAVGTDINPRAVRLASIGAALSGLTNISFATGSLFAPVEGRRFDLIVSNPPYVISPESTFTFRDAAIEGSGEAFCREVVRAAPPHLADGGVLMMLANWVHIRGDWRERLASWFAGLDCQAWVIRTTTRDPAEYATGWIRHTSGDGEDFSPRLARWIEYFERRNVEAVSAGLIVLRRAANAGLVTFDDVSEHTLESGGLDIMRSLESRAALARLRDPASILASRLVAPSQVRLDQRLHVPPEVARRWRTESVRIFHVDRPSITIQAEASAADLILACDGRRTLAEICGEMSMITGRPREAIETAAAELCRRLILAGILSFNA